jgi:hypothetical protein
VGVSAGGVFFFEGEVFSSVGMEGLVVEMLLGGEVDLRGRRVDLEVVKMDFWAVTVILVMMGRIFRVNGQVVGGVCLGLRKGHELSLKAKNDKQFEFK